MAQFVNLTAAADGFANGAILVPEFQSEILDLVRRSGVFSQRINWVPATGSPSRYFEQTAIGSGAFSTTGGLGGGTISPTPTSPTRVEKALTIKAITNQINYSLFDMETVAQQGVFTELKAKDMRDMVSGLLLTHADALWNGTDDVSGSLTGAGTTLQYVGLTKQITNTMTIASSASIVDSIRTKVAQLMNSLSYNLSDLKFSIYINPIALDYLEQEAKNGTYIGRYIESNADDLGVGVSVTRIRTAAGSLPLIPDVHLKMNSFGAAAPVGENNYPFAIIADSLVEYHYIGPKQPRVFQLGTVSNLNEQYVAILFGAPVAKGGSYAHVIGNIQKA